MTKRKRSNGEGSIYQIKDGTWRAAITLHLDALGKPRRKVISGKTQREVREKLRTLQRLKEENALSTPHKMTLAQYLTEWQRDTLSSIKPTTAEKRQRMIDFYIVPYLGGANLSKLSPLDVQRWQTALLNTPRHNGRMLSPSTVAGAVSLLFSALKAAVQLGLMHRNPVEAIKRVRPTGRKMDIWEPQEVAHLMEVAKEHRLYALVYVAMTTGMRRGELCGLRWEDIDMQSGSLTIKQNCVLVNDAPVMQTPKTAKSQRRIILPADAIQVLRQHHQQQENERMAAAEDWQETGLVFTTRIGTIYHPRTLLRDWYALLKRAGLRRIRLHDIRHTYASLAIYQGMDPHALADRLGHANTSMTLDVYGHIFEEQRERAALSLDSLLGKE